jgi:hypothetical protein
LHQTMSIEHGVNGAAGGNLNLTGKATQQAFADFASKRTRSSITEHSFQGITPSPRGGSVTYVSGTNCHPCVGPLISGSIWFS